MAGHRRFLQGKDKRMWRTAAAAAALVVTALLAARPVAAQKPADEVFRARAAISLPNGQKVTSFDISYDDPALGLYFLADRTNKAVDVVDVQTNQVVEQLTANFAGIVGSNFDQAGPNGILTVEHRFLWAGDFGSGLGGLVKVIDLTNGSLVATINTGGTARADELCYDPVDHVILIANDAEPLPPSGAGPYVTFINSQTYQVLGRIFMNGQNGSPLATNGIEQCQWSRKIDKTFNIPHNQCEGPQGMAIGPENQILLGCNDPLKDVPSSVVINLHNGNVIHVLRNEDGSDQVWFNHGDGHYFLAESGGANPQHLGVVDAQTGKEDRSPQTGLAGKGGVHSVAADATTLKVFVPIATTSGAGVCSSVGGDDSDGCIAVFKAARQKNEEGL